MNFVLKEFVCEKKESCDGDNLQEVILPTKKIEIEIKIKT
jgi:hypothetical protein